MNLHSISRRRFVKTTLAGGGGLWLGWPHRFSWAQEPATDTGPLTVVYYTDIHARVEWDTPEAMLRAAAAMNEVRPDVILCGGDMITDGYTSSPEMAAPRWDAYLAMHRAIRPVPVCAVGNHDLVGVEPADGSAPVEDPRAEVRAQLGLEQTCRSFTRAGYHFILLDSLEITTDELKYRGHINEEQMAWLRDDLAGLEPATPVILLTHMPLLTSFFQATAGIEVPVPANRGVVNNQDVLAAFEGHRLLAVLQGHLHVNEMLRWRDTTFITGGAICGRWWRGRWQGTAEGFGILRLFPDRVEWAYQTYGWEARRPDGA